MKIAPLAEVKAQFSAYIEQCETQGPIVITRNGKAVAVLSAPARGCAQLSHRNQNQGLDAARSRVAPALEETGGKLG